VIPLRPSVPGADDSVQTSEIFHTAVHVCLFLAPDRFDADDWNGPAFEG
jgi:hypothetical protein